MSLKRTQEEEDQLMEAEAELSRIKFETQNSCSHWRCSPIEWWWSNGRIRTLRCDECDLEKYFEEDEGANSPS
jgi:hypothetical protein